MAILSEGQILIEGNPTDLVDSIQGKIWSKVIDKKDIEIYKKAYSFISSTLVSGETLIKVIADQKPEEGFQIVKADLEDFYFATIASY